MSLDNWYEYAYALFKCGESERSESIISQLSQYGESISSCLWLGRIAEEKGNYKLALLYERTEKQLADTLIRVQLSQSLFKAQSEQDRLTTEIASREKDFAILFTILIAAACAGIILWLTQVFKRRQVRLGMEKERALMIAEKASEMLSKQDVNSFRLQHKT